MADVVDLITQQHRQLDDLLQQAEKAEPEGIVPLLQQVADLLLPHSRAEESFVYPAIARVDRDESDEVHDGVAEHHHVEGLLQELLGEDPSGPGYDGKLAAMIGELRHHVEEEEQELLPVLREKASEAERAELGDRFAAETTAETAAETTAEAVGSTTGETDGSPGGGDGAAGTSSAGTSSAGMTKDELYRKAQEQEIPGRSSMTKAELAEALARSDAD